MSQELIRVLIVEDSAYMRLQLRGFIEEDKRFAVVGAARDGEEALKLVKQLKPDVMTLDLQLPKMDGIEVLGEIMKEHPVPVLVVSVLAKENADIAMKALDLGAVDFVTKPTPAQMPKIKEELLAKLYQASKAKLDRLKTFSRIPASPMHCSFQTKDSKVVVFGSSIGGPQSLHYLLPQFPSEFPAPILVVQHMPRAYTEKFVAGLRHLCKMRVKAASEGEKILPGTVYIAPGGIHLVVDSRGRLNLEDSQPVNSVKPSVDVTLLSASRIFRKKLIAVILTGMGKDGTDGAIEVKKNGGIVVAETEASCVVYGMSKSVIEAGACDYPLSLEEIVPFLLEQLECRIA